MNSVSFDTESFRRELSGHIIPFWSALRDDVNGGFCGRVSFDNVPDMSAVKGCILHSRILWFFSNAYMTLGDGVLLDNARHAYDFICRYCLDGENGGIYWSVAADGTPEDTTKHTYNQAFAVYALSSYSIASGDGDALRRAAELFDVIETRCTDDGGYLEAFDRVWNAESNEKLSENGVMAARTMNTLLHVIEAYTELLRAGYAPAADSLRSALRILAEKVYSPERRRLEVFFDSGMEPIIDLHSYGHDIEASWLIDRACDILGDSEITAVMRPITDTLAENILSTAFTGECLLNECERGKVNEWRIWWVEAEAVIGFFNAWQKHPERAEFRSAAAAVWDYINGYIIDRRSAGEWYSQVDPSGKPDAGEDTVGEWKCPYHNGRLCMEMMRRLAQS